jgi:hypothetical protein
MNEQDQLRAAQAARAALAAKIRGLESELAHLDEEIAVLAATHNQPTLPCWECRTPQAVWVRHWLNNNPSLRAPATPTGLPQNCCRAHAFESRSSVVAHA